MGISGLLTCLIRGKSSSQQLTIPLPIKILTQKTNSIAAHQILGISLNQKIPKIWYFFLACFLMLLYNYIIYCILQFNPTTKFLVYKKVDTC